MRIDDENKVVVPQFVGDYIEIDKSEKTPLNKSLNGFFFVAEDKKVFDWLFGNEEEINEKRNLIFVKAWVEGYTIETRKYYWHKKKEHLAWFEDFESVLIMSKNSKILRFGDISSYDNRYFEGRFTEQEARELLKDDFDKFEKVECD